MSCFPFRVEECAKSIPPALDESLDYLIGNKLHDMFFSENNRRSELKNKYFSRRIQAAGSTPPALCGELPKEATALFGQQRESTALCTEKTHRKIFKMI